MPSLYCPESCVHLRPNEAGTKCWCLSGKTAVTLFADRTGQRRTLDCYNDAVRKEADAVKVAVEEATTPMGVDKKEYDSMVDFVKWVSADCPLIIRTNLQAVSLVLGGTRLTLEPNSACTAPARILYDSSPTMWAHYYEGRIEICVTPLTGDQALKVLRSSRWLNRFIIIPLNGEASVDIYDDVLNEWCTIDNVDGIIRNAAHVFKCTDIITRISSGSLSIIPMPHNEGLTIPVHLLRASDNVPKRVVKAAPAPKPEPAKPVTTVRVTTVPVIMMDMDDDDDSVEVIVNTEDCYDR